MFVSISSERSRERRVTPRRPESASRSRGRMDPRPSRAREMSHSRSPCCYWRPSSRSMPATSRSHGNGSMTTGCGWTSWTRRSEAAAVEAAWHRAAGDATRAREHAEQALAHATAPRQPLALHGAHRTLGILDTEASNGAAAAERFAKALALADACRSLRACSHLDRTRRTCRRSARPHDSDDRPR